MYLRHTTREKDGKTHVYWRLVRSVRRGGKVVQETVAQLGELDSEGRAKAKLLARRLGGQCDQRELFEEEAAESPMPVAIRLDAIRLERSRQFGDVWLASKLWQVLGLDKICGELLPPGREKVSWAKMASILVLARLCEPSSELHISEGWYRRTAMEDIVGVPVERVNDDRLYRALDRLVPHKEALERHLHQRFGELFSLEYDLLLYDVTSTYFEGLCARNEMAKRGHSRDHRPDCKQVCIALVVTRDGIPLGYEIFEGNRVDVTTVKDIVEKMEKRFGLAGRVWVMDRGMASEANLEWLMSTGRRYVLGSPRGELRKWKSALLEKEGWQKARDGVEVKLMRGAGGKEVFVLCRSKNRATKETAIHQRFADRIKAGLEPLQRRLKNSRRKLAKDPIERQIGRLLGQNSRAAARFSIRVEEDPSVPSGLRLDWSIQSEWEQWNELSDGCYVLRSNVTEWTGETLWQTYIQLTQAEAAFRIHKSDLSLRPVWHQRADRVKAHILVCFLAFALYKTLEKWQEQAGLGNSPRMTLDEPRQIQSTDVVLPTAADPSTELRIRCIVRPDSTQALLLDRLGLRLPERLKSANNFCGM